MTEIKVYDGISIVTFNDVPASGENGFISEVFNKSADAGINVDMISQSPATSDRISFGFTFSDQDMPKLLAIINSISTLKLSPPLVNCGNVKINVSSPEMVDNVGFAARVFLALKELDCVPLLVTTGADEISLLVYESDASDLTKKLKEMFV